MNDAPALAAVDVGIAMSTGADVAVESARITLTRGGLVGRVRARKLATTTLRNVWQNLFFAFAYDTAAVPIAAGVLYPVIGVLLSPMIVAAVMSLSSVSVISNALRLRRVRLRSKRKTSMANGHHGHMPSSGCGMAISAWLTGVYFVIEMGIGLWTGSVAVISDAFHTFSAVGGVLVAIVAARLARRPADEDRSFGWYRAEIIGALVNGGFLLGMALVVIAMAGMRLWDPIDLPTGPMLLAAAGGLVTEFFSLGLIWKQSKSDLNVKGALWHIIQTFVGSLLIIVTALVIKFTGFLLIDPLLGMAFGFVLLWASSGILRDSIHLLMEGTPADISLPEVTQALESLEGVTDAHHVHAWALTSGKHVFSGHLRVHQGTDTQTVLKAAHGMLRDRFGFFFVTLQIEDRCLDESEAEKIDITRRPTTERTAT